MSLHSGGHASGGRHSLNPRHVSQRNAAAPAVINGHPANDIVGHLHNEFSGARVSNGRITGGTHARYIGMSLPDAQARATSLWNGNHGEGRGNDGGLTSGGLDTGGLQTGSLSNHPSPSMFPGDKEPDSNDSKEAAEGEKWSKSFNGPAHSISPVGQDVGEVTDRGPQVDRSNGTTPVPGGGISGYDPSKDNGVSRVPGTHNIITDPKYAPSGTAGPNIGSVRYSSIDPTGTPGARVSDETGDVTQKVDKHLMAQDATPKPSAPAVPKPVAASNPMASISPTGDSPNNFPLSTGVSPDKGGFNLGTGQSMPDLSAGPNISPTPTPAASAPSAPVAPAPVKPAVASAPTPPPPAAPAPTPPPVTPAPPVAATPQGASLMSPTGSDPFDGMTDEEREKRANQARLNSGAGTRTLPSGRPI